MSITTMPEIAPVTISRLAFGWLLNAASSCLADARCDSARFQKFIGCLPAAGQSVFPQVQRPSTIPCRRITEIPRSA